MASWHGRDLDFVLEELYRKAEELMRNKPAGELPPVRPQGSSEEEILAHEKKLGRPIPEPIRQMYKVVDGIDWCGEEIQTGISLLHTLSNTSWIDPLDYYAFESEVDTEWVSCDYYVFAKSIYFDMILYCDNPPWSQQGTIVMLDPNCSNGIPSRTTPKFSTSIVILADNFLDWIARWMACGFNEFAHSFNDEDYPDVQRDYLEDHIRLNPTVKWAKEKLEKLDPL